MGFRMCACERVGMSEGVCIRRFSMVHSIYAVCVSVYVSSLITKTHVNVTTVALST